MSNPETLQFTRSINDNEVRRDTVLHFDSPRILNGDYNRKNTHHSGAQRNDSVGSLRSDPNSKRRVEGVHPIAVNPSTTLSAERMSLAGIPEGIVSTNVETRDPLDLILLLATERVLHR